jgi:hypothetical protein
MRIVATVVLSFWLTRQTPVPAGPAAGPRSTRWPALQASAPTWRRRAKAREVALTDAMPDLDAI